ncbi:AAA family ATPase, partial [Okeania sp.]|uniref:trifunctional serine/threonine-protein kinase/ATP-binding protein/sensor histidine kinase n=1 Tax=Okeania sp. TaxID=3100323 RepID=UPI002B4AE6E9
FLGSNSSDTPSPPLPYSPTPRLLLVAGFSGIGKTAIVNEVHKPIVKQRGYFIKGKFDQFNRNIPFSALVQSFRDLMGQLLSESDTQLQQWKSKILEAVGVQGQVIIEVIPELEKIIGKQPGVPELSGSAAQNRFNLLFGKFIQVFTTKEHPLVIFLDDLQWADSASLNLMKLLMSGVSNSYLLMIGAYRDNEVFPAHPLMLTLDEMAKAGVIINTITLAPLSEDNINCLVADTLSCNREVAKPLTELIYQKTKGNPFFTTQFLLGLYKNKLISFNNDVRYWECDIVEVRQQTLTDDVVEFMAQRLQKLPAETQEVLKLAACIGNHFDLATLAIVYEQSQGDTATALWKALQEEFILPQSEVYKFYLGEELQELSEHREQSSQVVNYKFLHDRVQQGAYSLIPEDQKQATHLKIGELLLNNTPNTELDENLFEIVNQLNIGRYLVVELPKQIQIAELNLKVAQKARAATAYAAAYQYAVIGIDLLNSPHLKHSPWQTYYDLTLPIHELATETAYLNGDITCMEKWAKIVLQEAKNVVDKMGIYATKIQAYMGQAKKLDALKIGLEALELLDVNFPSSPSSADIEQALTQTASNLQGKEIKDLINLPMMTDVEKLAIAKMLTSIGPPSFQAARSLFPLVICKSVNLSLKYGNSPFSGYGYACYGIFLNAIFQDPDSAYKFGQLALKLSQCFNAPDMKSSVFMAVGVCTIHIKVHVKETLSILQEGYQSGLEGGNFEFPAYCAVNKCHYLYFLGQELSSLERDMETINDALVKFKQDNALAWNQTFQQSIINLRSLSKNPCNLEGEVYNEKTSLPQLQEADRRSEIFYVYINKLILSYLFEDYQLAQENALKAEQYLDAVDGILVTISFNFYDSLAHLAVGLFVFNQSQLEQILNRVNKNQEKMKQWATHAPMNFQHKYDLVEAEKSHIMGNNLEAIDLYDCAIAGARENEYIQEEALANELAAKFYLKWGKEKVAAGYMQEAYYCYARWGAKAKTDDLEKCYPNLLSPILKPAAQTLDPLETLSTFSKRSVTNHSSTTSLNSALDFTTVLKAAQAISGIIELDELLRQLTHIILQHSGGNRCALILPNSNGEWLVQAIATPESTEICYEPLENNPNLPTELIQYVKNTQETVVINDLKTDLPIIDRYLLQKKPKSVLCLPILNQGHLIGILYLKNFLVSGAFTRERVVVLNFLCTQAAIALENARLYEQSQAYAQKLEQSQLQIVQYEKMASLGNLMAGVAHEINNPLGFLNGSISNAQENLHDIMQHFQLYHKYYPDTVQAIAENAEEIDLDYLCEDMPKLLSSMKNATERIKNLSTSLRTFSRADTEHQLIADIHQGIDSTLMILKYRLKANQERPEIQVIKDYGDFSEVECFPGQLNQVFMNIIANAIDMFDEVAQSLSYSEIEAQPQKITIKTALLTKKNVVKIIIEDNGKGMTPEVKARIFDHLFTTKGVGKGTGLGLAIVRQIVVEKHGGTIDCISELGKGTKFIITLPLSMVC